MWAVFIGTVIVSFILGTISCFIKCRIINSKMKNYMKMKLLSLLVVLLVGSISIQGQQLKVNYKNTTSSLPVILQEYFRMQGVQHMNLTIHGVFNGKRAKIQKVSCHNGVFTESELLPEFVHFILKDSVETFDFMAVPYKSDSIRITCFYPSVDNMSLFTDTVRLDRNHILMETYTSGVGPEIPIMSYTSGIPNQVGIWYCGLRDSKVEPRKWHEKYGIDNYVYYTIRIEEDKPSSNDSFYFKISK